MYTVGGGFSFILNIVSCLFHLMLSKHFSTALQIQSLVLPLNVYYKFTHFQVLEKWPWGTGTWRLSAHPVCPGRGGQWRAARSGMRTTCWKSEETLQQPLALFTFSGYQWTFCFSFSLAQVLTVTSGSCFLCYGPTWELEPKGRIWISSLPSSNGIWKSA